MVSRRRGADVIATPLYWYAWSPVIIFSICSDGIQYTAAELPAPTRILCAVLCAPIVPRLLKKPGEGK